MLKLYLAKSGLESCLGSERRTEIAGFLEGARIRARFRQACGYWWVELKGDRHLAAMKHAHGGIGRLTYPDLTHVVMSLLARRLEEPLKNRRAL